MEKAKTRITGKPYEDLIFEIYKKLEPYADIRKNDRILGLESKTKREIDISIRKKIADHDILIIIQAKDHKKRADIKIIGEFDSVIRDIRASKGILICNAGFTKTAKDYALSRGIDLYTAHDASVKDWQTEIKIPVLRKHTTMTYSMKWPVTITTEMHLKKETIRILRGSEGFLMKRMDGSETTFMNEFRKAWDKGEIKTTIGKHQVRFDAYMDMFENKALTLEEPVTVEYEVNIRNFLLQKNTEVSETI